MPQRRAILVFLVLLVFVPAAAAAPRSAGPASPEPGTQAGANPTQGQQTGGTDQANQQPPAPDKTSPAKHPRWPVHRPPASKATHKSATQSATIPVEQGSRQPAPPVSAPSSAVSEPPAADIPPPPDPNATAADAQQAGATPQATAPLTPQKQQPQGQIPTFRSEVKLVNVITTVTDEHGAPVSSLKQEDFHVFEDGQEQKIAFFARESELPLSIALGIDASLSTRKDLPLELESARRFARTILRQQDGLSLYEFSEIVNQMLPFTSDLRSIDHAIERVRSGAATALYDYIYVSSDALNMRKGRKVLVVITDGGDTASKTNYQDALRAAQIAEAVIYPIIMVPIEASAGRETGGEHALIQLAIDTGGKYYYASSLNELDAAFRQISDELRTQYVVAYYPAERRGEEFRRIEIKLTPHDLSLPQPLLVRHRAGYYTSKLH